MASIVHHVPSFYCPAEGSNKILFVGDDDTFVSSSCFLPASQHLEQGRVEWLHCVGGYYPLIRQPQDGVPEQ